MIAGFTAKKPDALAECVLAHGGKHVEPDSQMPEPDVRVLFVSDLKDG